MWIFILIVLAVVVYFVVSQASSSNEASRTQASKASSQNYTNQVDYSNLEVLLDTSASNSYGRDYRHLRDLLAEGKWREADEETSEMILRVAKYDAKESYITPQIPQHTPCEDICTIDRLWLKYSNGRFGFSVQRRIISAIGDEIGEENALSIMVTYGKREGSGAQQMNQRRLQSELQKKFHRTIGWYSPHNEMTGLKNSNDLTFSIQAPYGHLPTANPPGGYPGMRTEYFLNDLIILNLLMRLSACGIAL